MADGYVTATIAGIRAHLIADPDLAALIGDRVVDEPRENITLPFLRFGRVEPINDDTDGTEGAIVAVGLEVYSRPVAGRTECARVIEAVRRALHRADTLTLAGHALVDVEWQTFTIERNADGGTYEGRIAFEVQICPTT